MPTPYEVTSTDTDLPVWTVDDDGTTYQTGALELAAGLTPAPVAPGRVALYAPDGHSLQLQGPDGTTYAVSSAVGTVAPANQNLVAWTYDPTIGVNSSSLTSGTLYLTAVYPGRSATITQIYLQVVGAAVTPTANENAIGLYSSAGTLLTSVNIDTAITSAGLLTATVPAAAVAAGQMYWVGILTNATTAPTVARGNSLNGADATSNVGLTAASYRFAQNGTGRTALPATITPASNTVNSFAGPWAAIA